MNSTPGAVGGQGRRERWCFRPARLCGNTEIMLMSIADIPKKRGRPATGRDPMLTGRMPQEIIEALSDFARDQDVSRSEALKRIVADHLKAKGYLK